MCFGLNNSDLVNKWIKKIIKKIKKGMKISSENKIHQNKIHQNKISQQMKETKKPQKNNDQNNKNSEKDGIYDGTAFLQYVLSDLDTVKINKPVKSRALLKTN